MINWPGISLICAIGWSALCGTGSVVAANMTAETNGSARFDSQTSEQGNVDASAVRSLCEMKDHPALYDGRLIEVQTGILNWMHGSVLYDLSCSPGGRGGVDLEWDEMDDADHHRELKTLTDKSSYLGTDYSRVDAKLIGRFVVLKEKSAQGNHLAFYVRRVVRAFEIEEDVPWPDGVTK